MKNLYSTGERDKFRTRLERNAQGGTEIYISHRGMQEVYTSTSNDQTDLANHARWIRNWRTNSCAA